MLGREGPAQQICFSDLDAFPDSAASEQSKLRHLIRKTWQDFAVVISGYTKKVDVRLAELQGGTL